MSPAGRLPGSLTDRNKRMMAAGRVRANHKRRIAQARLASGANNWAGGNQSLFDITGGAWKEAHQFVDDFDYVDGCGIDDCLIRRLQQGVVYAGSATSHHELPFQDLTIKVISEVERYHQKHGTQPKLLPRKKKSFEMKKRLVRKLPVRKTPVPASRRGTPLTTVVDEMFPKTRVGRPLLEVVSELYDSLKGAA